MATIYSVVVLAATAAVVLALTAVMWRERSSMHEGRIALGAGAVLAIWAVAATLGARNGVLQPRGDEFPPVGWNLLLALVGLGLCLTVFPSLRRLLSRQSSLILLHLWRFVGILFLVLMAQGQLPALFALPAGIGDILVAAAAPWVARGLDTPKGRRRAVAWNLLGLADLFLAIGLGVTTNPGAAQLFHTVPDSQVMARFPMALVPTFLVPLAMTLHGVSLWQLLGKKWAAHRAERRRAPRVVSSSKAWRPAEQSGLS
jgi:hypothetical protein